MASREHVVLELGSGDGALTGILRGLGLRVVALDRRPPLPAGGPAVLGDALVPPLRPGSCDLVVAANLVRHLAPRRRALDFLAAWAALLRPGAGLYLFEDAPRPAGGAAGNYGALQALLARLAPESRGPLLAAQGCRRAAAKLALAATGGSWQNTWNLDTAAVLALLQAGRPRPGGEVAALAESVATEGVACGPAWWLRLAREDR
ncbi:MAG: methyltransferase domain-containing protein [Candidatus Krumholzibacteriia bacterium]